MSLRGSVRLMILIAVTGVYCQNISVITSDVLQGYDPQFSAGCYFPAELQGEFVVQINSKSSAYTSSEPIQYSVINITFNAIPVWGFCHKRIDNNILLIDRYSDGDCIRCFRLLRRSRNIIEVFSEDLNKCYTYEAAALESCGMLKSTTMLYRTKEVGGIPSRNEYCPMTGQYHFKYSLNNGSSQPIECNSFSSSLSNCPDGSILQLHFNRCSFELDTNLSFSCLGDWPGPDGSRYFALLDNNDHDARRPRYRCGLIRVDNQRGKTYVALSSDSSCMQNLENSTNAYETLILSKVTKQKKMPNYVKTHTATFPKWAQGVWEQSLIVNGTMTFTDLNGHNSYTFIAVEANEKTGRYIVYSKNQCEQAMYVCLMMKQRSENVFEFSIGMVVSLIYQNDLCDDPNVDKPVWMTQARIERAVESPCPITGEYTGMITDLSGMCAELSSNCNTPEIMYFKVSDCESGELFEERTYSCLGQWQENGAMYTYTLRNDTSTNECFVGLIVSDEEIYIKEAGNHCMRDINAKEQGMRLYRKGQCYGNSPSPAPIPATSTPHDPIMRITTTLRPKSSIGATKAPTSDVPSTAASCKHSNCFFAVVAVVLTVVSITVL